MNAISIRTFIGSKHFDQSREFYKALGFTEYVVGEKLIYFELQAHIGFYLQDYYVKPWVNNSMVFLEVEDVEAWHTKVEQLRLVDQYKHVRCSDIVKESWGEEFFLHDPEGILWHFGRFYPRS